MMRYSVVHFAVWAAAVLSASGHVYMDQIIAIEEAYYPREGGYCDNTPPEFHQTRAECCEVK